jgi:uncharacterized membrane protein
MSSVPKPVSRFTYLRNAFLSGLLLLAPLAVTWVVFNWLVDKVGGSFKPIFFFAVPSQLRDHPSLEMVWDVSATAIVILLITFLGLVSRYVFTAYFGRFAERIINNIPGIGTLYRTVKQIVDTFSAQKRNVFEKVVMVEYPAPGSFVVGFLTNRATGEVQARTADETWTIFIPTTPNPTSGFLIFYPRSRVTELDMSVGEAMKLIISGGTVVPPWPVTPAALPSAEPRSEAPSSS